MRNTCVFCGGEIEHRTARVIEEIGDEIIVVEGVPAGVCVRCGEKEFTPATIRELERIRRERGKITARRAVPVVEYGKLAA
ncbi:MAG: YgiT-type zinc finger protein [Armatimonadetes bacterium]|nr:YgiT-type zinc finger protein [Armatimonadota bacterium]